MRIGSRTFVYEHPPRIAAHASIVGPKESKGPLAAYFDESSQDDLFGQKTWEMGESEMLRRCAARAMEMGGLAPEEAQALFCGDLNDQIIATGFAARALGVPLVGLYGACSTFVEGLVLAAALISGGQLQNALCAASSHFCTAERQFRFPLEMGTQRPPSAQWTATAAGCALLMAGDGTGLRVTAGTLGRIVDYKIKDANHMGAAMAPAVESTICAHLDATGAAADDFDLIATGDLGWIGREILLQLFASAAAPCRRKAGGLRRLSVLSGTGHPRGRQRLRLRRLRLLRMADEAHGARGTWQGCCLVGSGAMLSPTSTMQSESIPGIAYTVRLEVK